MILRNIKLVKELANQQRQEQPKLNSISLNGGLQIKEINEVEYNQTTFDVTPVMSTYLLAMIVSDFECEDSSLGTGEDAIQVQ